MHQSSNSVVRGLPVLSVGQFIALAQVRPSSPCIGRATINGVHRLAYKDRFIDVALLDTGSASSALIVPEGLHA